LPTRGKTVRASARVDAFPREHPPEATSAVVLAQRTSLCARYFAPHNTQRISQMKKLNGFLAAAVFVSVAAVNSVASAGWLSDAMQGPVDLVAGGKKWNVLMIETDKGFDSVTFLPAGKTAEDAAETLTFTAVVESVPSSAYDAQTAIDQSHNNDNTTHYNSSVVANDQSVRARGLYVTVPNRTYSQLFSLKGSYLSDGKTFLGATYRVNVIANSDLTKKPNPSLDIMDDRVAAVSSKQIKDWFEHFHDKAKRKLAAKKQASTAPKS